MQVLKRLSCAVLFIVSKCPLSPCGWRFLISKKNEHINKWMREKSKWIHWENKKYPNIILTLTCDSLTRRRSCPCSECHSAQCCCCSPILGPGSKDLHWSVDQCHKCVSKRRNVEHDSWFYRKWTSFKGVWGGSCVAFVANLEDIVARFHICNVNPLAVDVCVVGIIASRAQALHIGRHPHKTKYKQTSY